MLGARRNTIEVNRAGRHTAENGKQPMIVSTMRVQFVRKKEEDDIPTIPG